MSYGKPGGKPLDEEKFAAERLRAELSRVAIDHCFEHGAKIINHILKHYHVTPKSVMERKHL